jgi:hypothetical protein
VSGGTKKKGKSKKKVEAKKKKPTLADRADRHVLYQRAVQSPEADAEFFARVYAERNGRPAKRLREDFCGTALLSCTWVQSSKQRSAVGIDLHGPTLDWGRQHNVSQLDHAQQARLELVQGDVLEGGGGLADVTCAMNFSYCVFKSRELLRRYFAVVHAGLNPGGVFVTELYGGTEAIVPVTDERECKGFTYVWEQESYDPITADTVCHIHFRFKDKSRIRRAFTYEWRLWTLPELRELLLEVGFSSVDVYWEEVDEDGDGTGEYHRTEHEENQESWLVYVVAAK